MIAIQECMKRHVFSIRASATIREAIQTLISHRIGLLPVVDDEMHPVGVVGLRDLLNLALPPVIHLLNDVDFIGNFGAVENFRPDPAVLERPVQTIMRPGTVVEASSGLLRSYALMLQHDLHDLPVVDAEHRLVGIASRVDIGTAILTSWVGEQAHG